MATGQIQTVEIGPARQAGLVQVISPYSREVLLEDTVDNAVAFLQAQYGFTENAARDLVRKGREVRGLQKGVGYINRYDAQPI